MQQNRLRLPVGATASSVDRLMPEQKGESVLEESLWFGEPGRQLFGRLTVPELDECLGGVLLAPPIGREIRPARRALRTLALEMAARGYVVLRFDHYGCGDSSGSMDDDFADAWIEGVADGVRLLRSLSPGSISAVGMRMGAPIVVKATQQQDLGLSSLVMWDPCETGRSYVRETDALGVLQRHEFTSDVKEDSKMTEYALSAGASDALRTFKLTDPITQPVAERLLIVVRSDRTVSSAFHDIWDSQGAEWRSSEEQSTMFEYSLPRAVDPVNTISEIQSWLSLPTPTPRTISLPQLSRDALVAGSATSTPVRERAVELGPRQMFGVLSEPVGDVRGPLVVFVNGVNEDHLGPARLWVEMARDWAEIGLRSLRFDLGTLGESQWPPNLSDRPVFDKSYAEDVVAAVRALLPDDPGNSVLIGYCSGALLAYDAASQLGSQGVCSVSPELVASVFRNVSRVKHSQHGPVHTLVTAFEQFLKRHRLEAKVTGRLSRLVRAFAFPPPVPSTLSRSRTNLLIVLAREDLPKFPHFPFLGRRLASTDRQRVIIVPGMDHNLLNTKGRERAVEMLERYVVDTYLGSTSPQATPATPD